MKCIFVKFSNAFIIFCYAIPAFILSAFSVFENISQVFFIYLFYNQNNHFKQNGYKKPKGFFVSAFYLLCVLM